ncbi:MAG: UPF0179 family protein [Thermoplasmata archaeon]
MSIITAVGSTQAKEGYVFIYAGPVNECRDCRYKNACINLEKGKAYKVTAVRKDKTHECKVHEKTITIVEVEKVPCERCIPNSKAIEGSLVTLENNQCKELECINYRKCVPLIHDQNEKYRIVSIVGDAECKLNKGLKIVLVE